MKFAIVLLCTLALAMSAQASVWPWGPWGPASVVVGAPAAWPGAISLAQGPVVVGAPAAAVIGAGPGTYVAKTLGAVHTAPLDGHIQSVASVNVAPAPGTL